MTIQVGSISHAEELARGDYRSLLLDAVHGTYSRTVREALAEHGRAILVDGSMYSPSWRALDGGGAVYDATEYSDLDGGNYCGYDAYTETLDRLTGAYEGPNGEYLFWDEGCLFVGIGDQDDDEPHQGHYSLFGTYWCDTCNSPYCENA